MNQMNHEHEFDLSAIRAVEWLTRAVIVATFVISTAVLSGWLFRQPLLMSINPRWVAMNPLTALTFICCACWFLCQSRAAPLQRWSLVLALVPIAVGLAKLLILMGIDLGMDQLLFSEALNLSSTGPNRMAPNTALCFALLGGAMIIHHERSPRVFLISQIAALLTMLISMLALTGYAYGVVSFMQVKLYIPMAFHTAGLFFLLSWALWGLTPRQGVLSILTRADFGGRIARAFLPLVMLLVPGLGWIWLAGEKAGFYGHEFSLAVTVVSTMLLLGAVIWHSAWELSKLDREVRREKLTSERLLLNILPHPIAERLKRGEHLIAENFSNVTVLFADIVNFTEISEKIPPTEVVGLLNAVFSHFDRLADKYRVEKIKTIGDAYMVVGGVPDPQDHHAEGIADMALEMCEVIEKIDLFPMKITMRMGIHTGNVIAGVIGERKFIYDLWGDTVNTASRMESHGLPGRIHVTREIRERLKEKFVFDSRGAVHIKGKGILETYFLVSRKQESAPHASAPYGSVSIA